MSFRMGSIPIGSPPPTADARLDLGVGEDAHHVLFPYPPERGVKNYGRAARIVGSCLKRFDDPVRLQTVTGVPHKRMPTYMNAADALLLTSNREGSPDAVKEALACNLPVVSTDVGDVRERLEHVEPSAVRTTEDGLADALEDVLRRGTVERASRRPRDQCRTHPRPASLGVSASR